MTTSEEALNNKLLERAGFTYYDNPIAFGPPSELKSRWYYPDGAPCNNDPPHFPSDLNAIFEWLVPAQDKEHNISCVEIDLVPMPEGGVPPTTWLGYVFLYLEGDGRGKGNTPALALSRAFEALMDRPGRHQWEDYTPSKFRYSIEKDAR